MKKSLDWAEKYFARQGREIRKFVLDGIKGKTECILTATDPAALDFVYALLFMVR